MMCGLASSIGSPLRLKLSALFLSGLVAEILFAVVAEVYIIWKKYSNFGLFVLRFDCCVEVGVAKS